MDIGGKERRLRYTYNSICDVEERAGLGIGGLFSKERVGFNTIRLLLWGALKADDKGLTVDRTGNLLGDYLEQDGDLEVLYDELMVAFEKSGFMGKQKEGE